MTNLQTDNEVLNDAQYFQSLPEEEFENTAIIIVGNGQKFTCDVDILQKTSRWFYCAIQDRIKCEPCENIEIKLSEISPPVFLTIYKWMRDNELNLGKSCNLKDIIIGAKFLQMPDLVNHCVRHLPKTLNLTTNNAMLMYQNALDCKNTFQIINTEVFLGEHFQEICSNSQFYTYSVQQICNLLSLDNLNIKSETEVFKAAYKWLRFNWGSRGRHTIKVLSTIRFGLMNDEELLNILLDPRYAAVMQINKIKQLILNGFLFHIAVENNKLFEYPDLKPNCRTYMTCVDSTPNIPTLQFPSRRSTNSSISHSSKFSETIPSQERKLSSFERFFSPKPKRESESYSPASITCTPRSKSCSPISMTWSPRNYPTSSSKRCELTSFETPLSSAANKLQKLTKSPQSESKPIPQEKIPTQGCKLEDFQLNLPQDCKLPFPPEERDEINCNQVFGLGDFSSPKIIQTAIISPRNYVKEREELSSSEEILHSCPITRYEKRDCETEVSLTETEDDDVFLLRPKDILGRQNCEKHVDVGDCVIKYKPVGDEKNECKLSMTCKLADTKSSRLLGI